MMKHFLLILCLMAPVFLFSQDKKESKPVTPPRSFTSTGEVNINSKNLSYETVAQEIHLKNNDGEAVAAFWSVSYFAKTGNADRPVMFIFNGGPGSASVWLHMGFFGPKVVKVPSGADEDDGAAPFQIIENNQCLLDLTDLVFIDPVGTGYSKVVGKGENKDYWGLNEDANSVAKFIRTWISKYNRWQSPKYIAGESFGTTRAAAVSQALEGGGQNMALNGIIMISQALDYAGSTSVHHNITSYLTYLPSMAATSWYHKKAGQGKSLEAFVQEARDFTYNTYGPALYKGAFLDDKESETIAEKVAYFTGLDKNYILNSDLRVLMPRYQKKLLENEGLTLGRLDGRYKGKEFDQTADRPTLGDAASYQISSAYTAALNHYFQNDLKVKMERPYLTGGQVGKWKWRDVPEGGYYEPSYVNTAPRLGASMRRNLSMRILVASGYYDLITPFFDAEYTFSRNGIPSERVEFTYYEGGHMMYNHQPSFDQLAKDIREFLSE
ncbi:MAG: peptidase S10 [Cytophagales bacterium]|nr:peptidase S10 [Cytophagales bacterium]